MKIYKTQAEVEADIKDGMLNIDGDVKFECSISIKASINAGDIDAGDIDARNINAWDINAKDILYYAFCCVYNSIKCKSIKAKRDKHQEPICLDGNIEYKDEEETVQIKIYKKSLDALKENGIEVIE